MIACSIDLEGNFISFSNGAERITGYARSEALQMNLAQLVAPNHLDVVRQILASSVTGYPRRIHDLELLRKDGRRIALRISTRLIRGLGKTAAPQGIVVRIFEPAQEREWSRVEHRESEAEPENLGAGPSHAMTATDESEGSLESDSDREPEEVGRRAATLSRLHSVLKYERHRRRYAEEALHKIRAKFKTRLEERTVELSRTVTVLSDANASLNQEIAQRAQEGALLRQACSELAARLSEETVRRQRVEESQRKTQVEFEVRVEERHAELSKANEILGREVVKLESQLAAIRAARAEAEEQIEERGAELSAAKELLKEENSRRVTAETALTQAQADFQAQTEERNAELLKVFAQLQEEGARREQSEAALREAWISFQREAEERSAQLSSLEAGIEEERVKREQAEEALHGAHAELESRIKEHQNELSAIATIREEEGRGRALAEQEAAQRRAAFAAAIEDLRAEPARLLAIVNEERARPEEAGEMLRATKDDLEAQLREQEAELAEANAALLDEIGLHEKTQETLRQVHEKLAAREHELCRQGREMSLLIQMGSLLQACTTIDELYSVLAEKTGRLFAPSSGALCVTHPAKTHVDSVVTWGPFASTRQIFAPEDCWALRRGRAHHVADTSTGLLCRHLQRPLPAAYMCAPILARGEFEGILHLCDPEQKDLPEFRRQLALSLAEHIALAFASLKVEEVVPSETVRDPVTGLFNRRFLEESLSRELLRATRAQQPLGVVMIELDRLKEFDEAFGRDAGETLLREFAFLLQNNIRAEDIVCRFSGERFGLILPETSAEVTSDRTNQIQAAVKNLRACHKDPPLGELSISFGVAVFPDHGANSEAILREAEAALLRAKRGIPIELP